MVELKPRSAALFQELVQALVEEGLETGQFEIDSMRYAQMELLGHGLGQELSRQVQQALAERQGQRMADVLACPTCGRECVAEQQPKPMTSLDGDVELPETRCFCKKCRRSFFPSA
jgi:hypothetical protein